MTAWRGAVAVWIVSMGLQAHAAAPEADFKQTNEWKALNRFVGSWDQQATVTVPQRSPSRILSRVAWTLGDRFLEDRCKSELDNSEDLFLFTYDPNRRAIRCWWFNSSGQTGVSTGSWDEASSTLTFEVDNVAPASCTITDHLIDDDHREGKVVFTGADGKVTYESTSKATRRKN
jgi:hypothetical protein